MITFSIVVAALALAAAVVAIVTAGRRGRYDALAINQVTFAADELAMAKAGDKISFVKVVRETHGLSLRQAATAYDVLRARR